MMSEIVSGIHVVDSARHEIEEILGIGGHDY